MSEIIPFSIKVFIISREREVSLLLSVVLLTVVLLGHSEGEAPIRGAPIARTVRPLCADGAAVVLLLPSEVSLVNCLDGPLPHNLVHIGAEPVPSMVLLVIGITGGPFSCLCLHQGHVHWLHSSAPLLCCAGCWDVVRHQPVRCQDVAWYSYLPIKRCYPTVS